MRPEARLMAGYYPCPPEALSKLIAHLESPEVGSHVALLDPCAGEGKAIQHIARKLQVPDHRVWMVELDPARGDACRKTMPGATVLAPASFLQTSIRGSCFSLIYCNPPFDDHSAKGTRVEEMFLRQAVELVANGGLLAFVCPEYVTERPEFRRQTYRVGISLPLKKTS